MLNIPIEVQDALREGALRKNYKMKVNDVDPDTGERTYLYTIDNDTLVSESVKIDERMVTGKVLKFGLCEGSSLEFQYFDHPNINGKDIQVYCSVEYVDGNGDVAWYDIPMGWYSVDQCPMQWDTGIFKVTAYNKLKSKYLDAKANKQIIETVKKGELGFDDGVTLETVLQSLLSDYSVESDYEKLSISFGQDYSYLDVAEMVEYDENEQPTGYSIYYNTVDYGLITSEAIVSTDYYSFAYNATALSEIIYDNCPYLDNLIKATYQGSLQLMSIKEFIDNVKALGAPDFIQFYYGNSQSYYVYYANSDENVTPYVYNLRNYPIYLKMSGLWKRDVSGLPHSSIFTQQQLDDKSNQIKNIIQADIDSYFYLKKRIPPEIASMVLTEQDAEALPDVTLRELQSAVYETVCQYGQLNRETDLFEGVELNQGGLYPADTLYPDNALYPQGNMEHPFPSTYSKLWTDTVGEQSFRYLIITYKAIDNGQEVEKKLQRTVNADGTTDYNMSDNWLFRNLVWSDADVGAYADAMVLKMQNIRWFPFEMWCAGLPYVETGDAIEITDRQGDTHTSYVLTRTLDGIHNLQDTFINGELDIF